MDIEEKKSKTGFLKYIFYTIVTLLIIFIVSVGGTLYWVSKEAREIPYIASIIEYQLSDIQKNTKVHIGHSNLSYDVDANLITALIKDISVIGKDKYPVLKLDKFSIEFNLNNIFGEDSIIESASIKKGELYIPRDEQVSEAKKVISEESMSFLDFVKDIRGSKMKMLTTNVSIIDSKVILKLKEKDAVWHIKRAVGKEAEMGYNLDIKANFEGKNTDLILNTSVDTENRILLDLKYDNVPVFAFAEVFEKVPFLKILSREQNYVFISGEGQILINHDGSLSNAQIDIHSGKGHHVSKDKKNPVIEELTAKLSVTDDRKNINLSNFNLRYNNGAFFNGQISIGSDDNFTNVFGNNVSNIKYDMEIKDLGLHLVESFWPEGFGKSARQWVVSSMYNGKISSGKISVDLGKEFFKTLKIDEKNISAEVHLKDISLNYHNSLLDIHNIEAIGKFNHELIDIKVLKGKLLNSNVGPINVVVPYSVDFVTVSGDGSGVLADLSDFVPDGQIDVVKNFGIDLKKLTGKASTHFQVYIPITMYVEGERVRFMIESEVENVILSESMSAFPIDKGKLIVSSNAKEIAVSIDGVSKGEDFSFAMTNEYANKDKYLFNLDFILSQGNLFSDIRINSGRVPLNVSIKKEKMNILANFDGASVNFKKLGWVKPAGRAAILKVSADVDDGNLTEIKDFSFLGQGIDIQGKGNINKDTRILESFSFSSFKFDGNDFILNYSGRKDGFSLDIKGNAINARKISLGDLFKDSSSSSKNSDISAKIGSLLLKEKQKIGNFDFTSKCLSNGKCSLLNIKGDLGDSGKLNISVKPEGDKDNISISADNAYVLLRGLGITTNTKKGKLDIQATKSSVAGKQIINGKFALSDFTIQKTSFLAKMLLRLTSVGGVIKLGSGSLQIDKFNFDFSFDNGILKISNGKMVGPSIKMTLEGNLNTKSKKVDLKGSVIPSVYGINTLLGKLPIVGKILGGTDDAVVAATYKMTGRFDDIKTSVNPLSLFAPGIFRKIFE